jgi:hypothetical protein
MSVCRVSARERKENRSERFYRSVAEQSGGRGILLIIVIIIIVIIIIIIIIIVNARTGCWPRGEASI